MTKRNARPSLFENTTAFDDPLEMLLACHRKIEKQLDTLLRLRAYVAARGVDPEASSAAQGLLRYFARAAADHHDDEECDLFPLLERRIADRAQAERFRAQRESLEADHRRLEAQWMRLRKPVEGIAEGFPRPLDGDEVREFAAGYARHIAAEEAALTEYMGWLGAEDRATLGRSMSARRAAPLRGL